MFYKQTPIDWRGEGWYILVNGQWRRPANVAEMDSNAKNCEYVKNCQSRSYMARLDTEQKVAAFINHWNTSADVTEFVNRYGDITTENARSIAYRLRTAGHNLRKMGKNQHE